jgi:hypothetical protein
MYRREEGLGSNAPIRVSHDLPGGWDKSHHWSYLPALYLLQVSSPIDLLLVKQLSNSSFAWLCHHFANFEHLLPQYEHYPHREGERRETRVEVVRDTSWGVGI